MILRNPPSYNGWNYSCNLLWRSSECNSPTKRNNSWGSQLSERLNGWRRSMWRSRSTSYSGLEAKHMIQSEISLCILPVSKWIHFCIHTRFIIVSYCNILIFSNKDSSFHFNSGKYFSHFCSFCYFKNKYFFYKSKYIYIF